jgi:hypothetical protein
MTGNISRFPTLFIGMSKLRGPTLEVALSPKAAPVLICSDLDGSGNASPESASITVTTLDSEEGLQNGNCEIGLGSPARWQTEAFKPTAAFTWELAGAGRNGTRCISIEAGADLNDARWLQEVTGLVPNGRYLLRGWLRGDGVVLDPGATIGANLCGMAGWDHTLPTLIGTFEWTEVQCHLTANHEGGLTVAFRLGYWGSLAGGKAWFDDVSLTYAPIGPVFER